MQAFFSIIIPVYNTEKYLSRCFDSFLEQSFDCKKIEVVVVNDASPDVVQYEEIISAYKEKLNIKCIKLDENMGTYIARACGVDNSTGKYLLFVDPDDYLRNDALEILYKDIQTNGEADYIWFLFSILHKNGSREIVGHIKDINSPNVLEDILNAKVGNNVATKCFNALFAKEIWRRMPQFYSIYVEDYYQMAILHYYARKKRFIKRALYVYVQGVGITGQVKYSQEKLKKIILSIYNVDKYLSEFYEQKNSSYVPLINNCLDGYYFDCIFRSSFKDFNNASQDIIGKTRLKKVTAKYILNLKRQISTYKKRERYFLPIIIFCSFLFKSSKKNKKEIDITKVINVSTGTLEDDAIENDIFECISYLEQILLFYQERVKFYAPIKSILHPFWLFCKKVFRR